MSCYTCLLTSVLFPQRIGWTALPCPPRQTGTGNKLHSCAGCRRGLSTDCDVLACYFSTNGFAFDDSRRAVPCKTAYHVRCLRVGPPFTTRRQGSTGLQFPKVKEWGTFICEACTVRAVSQHELTGPNDWSLLCFERMRLLDMAHYWSQRTHDAYQGKLQVIRAFEADFDISVLRATPLLRPPNGREIPLMWCQEAYSLRHSPNKRNEDPELSTLAFSTIRQLRSAASQFLTWDMMVSCPNEAFMDNHKRIIQQPCRPTDGLGYTLHASGMSARIGDQTRPSLALLDRHIRALDRALDHRYLSATTHMERLELALAGLANLLLWLGWLRSSEAFGLAWSDLHVIEPCDSAIVDLPEGCGLVSCRLGPETKSARTHRADVPLAYKTLSGFHIGKWFHRARHTTGLDGDWRRSSRPIFLRNTGSRWTSKYFRDRFLYPSLHAQRAGGDPYLQPFDGSPGNSIENKVWSLHCYRRGARSHVSKGGRFGRYRFRKANDNQIYLHARWRRRRSAEAIDKMYLDWPLRDRIKLTLYSQ